MTANKVNNKQKTGGTKQEISCCTAGFFVIDNRKKM
nr:MAG TPA: hypothetical protein [Caudoviricetes sp.]